MLNWQRYKDKIILVNIKGEKVKVSASEIVGAEFKNRMTIQDKKVKSKPSEFFPYINFHRFPLNVQLCIAQPNKEKHTPAVCWVEIFDADYRFVFNTLVEDQLLIDGEWFPLVTEEIQEINKALDRASITKLGVINLRQYFDLLKQESKHIITKPLDDLRYDLNQIEDTQVSTIEPSGFQGHLYDYQSIGVKWLISILSEDMGCILADEMGLGKTIQVIALLLIEKLSGRFPSIVIAPATLLENWRREIIKFCPTLKITVHRGQDRTGFPSKLTKNDIVITSYETAVRDMSMLKMIKWNIVILDEAQAIKNPDALRSTFIKNIPRRIGLAVTGTPLENRLRDLWSIMDFTCPGLLGSRTQFEDNFIDSVSDAASLEPVVSPLILRRLVSEVADDLPERIDIPQPVELSEETTWEYEYIRKQIIDEYGTSATLVALVKLRMFCTHPFLITGQSGDPAIRSSKYRRLLEIFEEIYLSEHKAILFTSFTGMADIILEDMHHRYDIYCNKIDGRTPVEYRQEIVDQFQRIPKPALLVLNPRAAGTGLNITAANHVIHYNLEWNPAIEDQATARAYRRGQKKPVTVHRLYHPNTVEEIINERIDRKRRIAQTAIVGTEGVNAEAADIAKALQISPVLKSKRNDE